MYKNGIKLQQGFKVIGQNQTIDDRLVLTYDDLLKIKHGADDDYYELNRWPQQYFAIVINSEGEDAQLYFFDKNKFNTPDSEGQKIGHFERVDYEYIKKKPHINGVEVIGDLNDEDLHLQRQLVAEEGIQLVETVSSEGKPVQTINVKIDGKSIVFDSNGKLVGVIHDGNATRVNSDASGSPIVDVLIDNKTILTNSENELELPIDYSTIIINSEGKLMAVPEPLADGIATRVRYDGRNETVDVRFDGVTIVLNSAGELCGSTQLHEGKGNEIVDSQGIINVLVDGTSIKINGANDLEVINDDKTVKVGADGLFVPIDEKTIIVNSEGKVSAVPEPLADGKATHARYDGENEIVDVNVDNNSLKIDSAGNYIYVNASGIKKDYTLVTTSEDELSINLVDGDGIRVDDKNEINVEYDSDSLKISHDNKIAVSIDDQTIKAGGAGLYVNIDNNSIYIGSEGKIKASGVKAGQALSIDTNKVADVLFDNKTIKLDSANRLYANIDNETLVASEGIIKVDIDENTIFLDSEGKLAAKQVKIDNKTIILNSEGEFETQIGGWKETTENYQFTYATGSVSASNPIITVAGGYDLPEVGQEIKVGVKVGDYPLTQEIFTVVDDGYYVKGENASHTYLDGIKFKKDLSEMILTFDRDTLPTTSKVWTIDVRGTYNNYHFLDGRYISLDNNSIMLDQTTHQLYATAKDLFAGEAITLDSENRINVLYDGSTVELDSEGKLHAKSGYRRFRVNHATFDQVTAALADGNIVEAYAGGIDYALTGIYADKYKFSFVDNITTSEATDVKVRQVILHNDNTWETVADTALQNKLTLANASALELGPITANNQTIKVLYDNDTITLDSEGKLHTDIKGLIGDVLTKVEPGSEGTFNTVVKNNKAYIDLSNYSTDSETGNYLEVSLDSEYKLTIDLYNVLGDKISSQMVDLPLEDMIIDGYYMETSEAGALVLVLKNGTKVIIPLDRLINGLVTLRTAQAISGSKNFTGDVQHLGFDLLSVANIDGVTIKWNSSEEVFEATGLEVKAGKAVEVISAGQTSEGVPVKLINVKYDNKTVKLDSEGRLTAVPEPLKDGAATHVYYKGNDEVVDVLYDEETIVISSEGDLKVPFDNKTIIINSEGFIETQIGGWKEEKASNLVIHELDFEPSPDDPSNLICHATKRGTPYAGGACTFVAEWYDGSSTINVNCQLGKWAENANYYIASDPTNEYVTEVKVPKTGSDCTVTFAVNHVSMTTGIEAWIYSDETIYHKIDGNYLPIDNSTIVLDTDGNLRAVAKDLIGGDAISIDSESAINVAYDYTLTVDSENNLHVNIDSESLYYNSSEGTIKVRTLTEKEIRRICY